ncbi:MAG: hypothetical protein GY941_19555 [Planctomycetes bacterium]|nr:hypothetical protein [Planctomycetota bacterium]
MLRRCHIRGDSQLDEQNINNWNIIEFQITAQKSKAFDKKMYRIPKSEEVLEIWGSEYYTYRENAHFEIEMVQSQSGHHKRSSSMASFGESMTLPLTVTLTNTTQTMNGNRSCAAVTMAT